MINIPPGVEHDNKMRYQGQGENSIASVPPGDLYVQITVANHSIFKRSGTTLECAVKIDAISAIIGTKHRITCIDGNAVDITIPPGTQPGSKMRILKKGMPTRSSTEFGDLIVVIELQVPLAISNEDIEILRAMQTRRGLDSV